MAKIKQTPAKEIKKEKKAGNAMREIEIEKVVLNCGGIADKFERSLKLLKIITGKKVKEIISAKRIPAFNVRPGLKTGCVVTLRGKEAEEMLKRLLEAVERKIKKSTVKENHFSFGIKEYLEIPGIEYQRDIGIAGLDVTTVFKRKGKRVMIKKIKQGRLPQKQQVSPEEIINYLTTKFNVEIEEPVKKGGLD